MCLPKLLRYCLLLVLLIPFWSIAQNGKANTSIGVQFHYGSFLTVKPKATYLKDSYSSFGEISYIKQTDGSEAWQVANHLPQVGFSLAYGNTGSRQYMGKFLSGFAFSDFKIVRFHSYKLSARFAGGVGWIEKPYDPVTNHKNTLIGSHFNAYVQLGIRNEVRLYHSIFLTGGVSLSHFSNGTFELPNLGLNIPAIDVGLRYQLAPGEKRTSPKDSFHKHMSYVVNATGGSKQMPIVGSSHYFVGGVSGEVNRHYSAGGAYGAFVQMFYDPSPIAPSDTVSIVESSRSWEMAAGIAFHKTLGRISVPVQVGFYLYNNHNKNFMYQSFGVRYTINSRWLAGAYLKTHMGQADFIHLGVGYHW